MKHRYTIENIENMRNEEMKMMNKREKTRKGITVFVTGLCLVAAAASVTAFGFTLNNVLKSNEQAQRPAVTAKLSENQQATQNAATIAATQPATTAQTTTAAATQTTTAKAAPGVHHSGAITAAQNGTAKALPCTYSPPARPPTATTGAIRAAADWSTSAATTPSRTTPMISA